LKLICPQLLKLHDHLVAEDFGNI